MEIDEEAAAIVRLIFDSYDELGSAGAVTRLLNDKGIRYPRYETRSGKQRGGNLFAKQKVTGILRNTVYIGRIRWGEEEHDGNHPPIISNEQFDRVQTQLAQTVKRRMNLRKPKGRHYLLSGLLRCSCRAHMVGYSTPGRNRTHYYYLCTRQSHEGGKYSCTAPRVPAEALEDAVIRRIREIGNALEAREKIVERAVACLDGEAEKLDQEADILRRQQQQTKADIGRLIEVLKSLGANALASVQDELRRLESEERDIRRRLAQIEKRREPMERISDDAKAFVRTWGDVGELLDAATHEERLLILRHYIEVIELHATDAKGKTGTYAMRLFPEVRPDRGFDWGEEEPPTGPGDASPGMETKNGDTADQGEVSASLTDSDAVCITDGKAPRGGLNPNRGFIELSAFRTKSLRRLPQIEMFQWNSILDRIRAETEPKRPKRDPMRLALQYQNLLDSKVVTTRAELARHLGVSRARVTQVLNRLNKTDDESARRRFGDTG